PGLPAFGPTSGRSGYWLVDSRGRVYAFGDAPHLGEPSATLGSARAVDIESTPSSRGYWVLDSLGGVHAFGDAAHFGNADRYRLQPGETVVSLSALPSG